MDPGATSLAQTMSLQWMSWVQPKRQRSNFKLHINYTGGLSLMHLAAKIGEAIENWPLHNVFQYCFLAAHTLTTNILRKHVYPCRPRHWMLFLTTVGRPCMLSKSCNTRHLTTIKQCYVFEMSSEDRAHPVIVIRSRTSKGHL
jgi:hypothetical protein